MNGYDRTHDGVLVVTGGDHPRNPQVANMPHAALGAHPVKDGNRAERRAYAKALRRTRKDAS